MNLCRRILSFLKPHTPVRLAAGAATVVFAALPVTEPEHVEVP